MRSVPQFLTITIPFLLLTGCATLSQDECKVANWQTIGFEDGAKGYSSERISAHRESCADYGIAPNLEKYLFGYRQGVRQYCVPSRGFALGRKGSDYNGICPTDLEQSFLSYYRQGEKVYELEHAIEQMKNDHRTLMQEHDDLIDEIENNEKLIISDNTSSQVRQELLEQNKKIEQFIADKDIEIESISRHIRQDEKKVERLIRKWR